MYLLSILSFIVYAQHEINFWFCCLVSVNTLNLVFTGFAIAHELYHKQGFWSFVGKFFFCIMGSPWAFTGHDSHHYNAGRGISRDPMGIKASEFLNLSVYSLDSIKRQVKANQKNLSWIIPVMVLVLSTPFLFGILTGISCLLCVAFSAFFIEAINLITHFGLTAKSGKDPKCAWQSNHLVDVLFLCGASFHGDHHQFPNTPGNLSKLNPKSSDLPGSAIGLILICIVNPAYFKKEMEKAMK